MEKVYGVCIIEEPYGTKGDLAKRLYPNMVIDCAVPQTFIAKLIARGFEDPARHLVTVYPPHDKEAVVGDSTMLDGTIMPITNEGIYMLAVLATYA